MDVTNAVLTHLKDEGFDANTVLYVLGGMHLKIEVNVRAGITVGVLFDGDKVNLVRSIQNGRELSTVNHLKTFGCGDPNFLDDVVRALRMA